MNIVITSGGTEEPIDAVRKITNMSTGKLGARIANNITDIWFKEKLISQHHIFYICNKNSIKPTPSSAITVIETTDVESVEKAIRKILKKDIIFFIHAMAISDYKVEGVYTNELEKIDNSSKMKSSEETMFLKLTKTTKIIDLIKNINPNTDLISFKLMNDVPEEELINTARKQLKRTDSTIVIANDLKNIKSGNHIAYAVIG